ncbi:thioredoxin-like protein [Fusarium tricinctum]|uniref:glutathione transferase n=1 Tax=Fusarium tricinctum TaxID=61284 RepID=A0A8K0S2C1_9HYPO|nr:thioredoxin-like protein [Fusarium tricinctum]
MAVMLYGSLHSTCTQRVILVLAELGVKYEFTDIKLQEGEHKAKDYVRSYHPFGRIPVLDNEGLRIFESRAICRYLVAKYGRNSDLYLETDQSPEEVAHYEMASSVEYSYFDPTMKSLAFEKVFKKFMGLGDPNLVEVSKLMDLLHTTLDYYEQITSKRDFLAQDKFLLIDLYHMPWIHFLTKLDLQEEISARPSLKAWWERASSRTAWRDLVARL